MTSHLPAGEPRLLPSDEFNRALIENVHPPDWKNPTPKGRYNLIVIGGGTAGLVSAAGAAALGSRVALIEKHLMGGDCTNYGCVPSKALVRSARAAQAVRSSAEFGVSMPGSGEVDFSLVMERMRRLRAQISVIDSAARFARLGVDVYLGAARFIGRHEVEVNGSRLSFSKAIVATGSKAADLSVPGLREAGYATNETVFSVERLPKRLLVIGSGPIGCELAQTFRRFGSDVVIVTRGNDLLPRDDVDAGQVLKRQFEREGIRMIFGARILRAEISGEHKQLVFNCGRGEERVAGDQILLAIGRQPILDGLDLDAAGVVFNKDGVTVDQRLQTSNPDIYAAGDVCSVYKFTHAAEGMARIALQNALFFGRRRMSDLVIPWCTYTDPEVAHVGINDRVVREEQLEIDSFTRKLAETDRSILDGETEGFVRIYAQKRNGRLLGVTIVGAHAGESIGEAVLAITKRLTVGDLSATIHPYPTQADAVKRAADLHLRSRLKPWILLLLKRYFRLRR
jgi:pyruvate/2-oxoglutarate dehydrogenase complex dihydrolipoamide dehydrogenase (E3) component